MKNFFIIIAVFFFTNTSNATWITSFEEAKREALITNKFMIVDFWASWCGPCKKMDAESWDNAEVQEVLQDYVKVKIDIDKEKQLASSYSISSIPNMFIMDANGKVVYTFSGFHTATELKRELDKFAFSTEFLSLDLINYGKNKNYNSTLRVSQKYFDYSMYVPKESRNEVIALSNSYIDEAKKMLSKKEDDYLQKKQRIELLELFSYAYNHKFDKLEKKLSEYKESDINELNIDQYFFLKYLTAKALNSSDFNSIQDKVKELEGFEIFIKKADFILASK
jgi:thiol-disulfide isomerase/thioredoxin